jgi:ribosome-associated heat shock protein Hsp15
MPFTKTPAKDSRLDIWLWTAKIFKSRTLSTLTCKKRLVSVNDVISKPSKMLKIDDIISVKYPQAIKKYQVLGLLKKPATKHLNELIAKDLNPEVVLSELKSNDKNLTKNFKTSKKYRDQQGKLTRQEREIRDRIFHK